MIEKVIADTTLFSGLCYGIETETTMSEKRGILKRFKLVAPFFESKHICFCLPAKIFILSISLWLLLE